MNLVLNAGPDYAGLGYVAALGHTGTEPGITEPLPDVLHVPLNIDGLTHLGLSALGGPLLEGFTGVLDAEGRASFRFHMPPNMPYVSAGETLVIAAAVFDRNGKPQMGSSAVEIQLGR